jgi:alpha-1,6-mannosyltransferase
MGGRYSTATVRERRFGEVAACLRARYCTVLPILRPSIKEMPIKTLHITNAYHPSSGGISTFYRALLNAANRHGRLMRLVVPGEKTKLEEIGEFGRIYYIAAPHAPLFDRRYRLMMPHTFVPPLRGGLRQILEKERPDLVEVCDKYNLNWLGGLLRRRWIPGLNRPVVVGLSCERVDDNVRAFITQSDWGKSWSRFYLGYCYIPLFDYHIANSQYTADELYEAMISPHLRPVFVRPMGADVEFYAGTKRSAHGRQKLIEQSNGEDRTRLLLYAGRISPEKNIQLLIKMMERLANDRTLDYRLIVAGSGPLADWLDREARLRVPGHVQSLGHLTDRAELTDLYANCDAFVHPNPREPFGIAPLEAMAAGLPLIAPRSGGVLSYADETNAWLAEANGEAFAEAVRSVFADPGIRRDKLARARWTAQQHNWGSATAQFFDLYDELHADFASKESLAFQTIIAESSPRETRVDGS